MSASNVITNILGKDTKKSVKIVINGESGVYKLNGQVFDCVVSSDTVRSNTITTNPVEFGTVVTDNIIPQPITINLKGVISAYKGYLNGLIQTNIPSLSGENNAEFWNKGLLELFQLKYGGTISLFVYPNKIDNLVIKQYKTTDTAVNGEGIAFDISLQEVQVAVTSLENTPTVSPSDPSYSNSQNYGNSGTTQTSVSNIYS